MAKDKKKQAAEKKARVAAKSQKKTKQKESKLSKKPAKNQDVDSDAEDVDIDAVLASYAKAQEQFLKVTETVVEPPSVRGSTTLLASPSNNKELLLFGGEYFDGSLARFYNDLFIYNTSRDEWRLITSPNSPLPRSGHAWTRGDNTGGVYLFGGEFSSAKQSVFYHYGDFWRLDSREWTKIESKGKNSSPPSRSGHRLVSFKQYVVLFGGFQDTSVQTKYLNDLWIYDTTTFTWHQPALPAASQRPEARSSFTFLPHEQGAVLAGGYSRTKATTTTRSTKGHAGSSQNILKPVYHADTWHLRITAPASDAPQTALPTVRWEKRKKPANAPAPPRAGVTMAAHKGRGIMFGGVHDVEESEEGIESEFFNQLYVWNVDRNRYFELKLRRTRGPLKKKGGDGNERGGRRGKAKADEMELLARLQALEARDSSSNAGGASVSLDGTTAVDSDPDDSDDDDDEGAGQEKPVQWEMPHPRFNAALAVLNDVLFIYGGTFEKGDREYTFDSLHAINLGKLDGVKEVFRRELADWAAEDSDEDDDDDDDEDDDDEDDDDEDDEDNEDNEIDPEAEANGDAVVSPTPTEAAVPSLTEDDDDDTSTAADPTEASDQTPYPRPFESLRAFYSRTSTAWQDILLAQIASQGGLAAGMAGQTVKGIRTGAFARAEERWWAVREEVRALEDEQQEAGIGEVVSLEERKGAGSGVGRRR